MRDIFYEESSVHNDQSEQSKYKLFKTLSIVFYVLLGLWFIFVYNTFQVGGPLLQSLLIIFVPAVALFLAGFFLGKHKNKFCVDYDYTIVSGHIRFSKVINATKRIHLYNFEALSIEKIGKTSNASFNKYFDMPDVEIEYLTSNKTPSEDKFLYYIRANVQGSKKVFVIECTEMFLVNLLHFTKRMILEKDD